MGLSGASLISVFFIVKFRRPAGLVRDQAAAAGNVEQLGAPALNSSSARRSDMTRKKRPRKDRPRTRPKRKGRGKRKPPAAADLGQVVEQPAADTK